jgi:hypothetical protein
MASGYDISASISDSSSATSGVAGAFSVTGGGGSSLSSAIKQSGEGSSASVTQSPPANKWITYVLIGSALLAVILLLKRFSK